MSAGFQSYSSCVSTSIGNSFSVWSTRSTVARRWPRASPATNAYEIESHCKHIYALSAAFGRGKWYTEVRTIEKYSIVSPGKSVSACSSDADSPTIAISAREAPRSAVCVCVYGCWGRNLVSVIPLELVSGTLNWYRNGINREA